MLSLSSDPFDRSFRSEASTEFNRLVSGTLRDENGKSIVRVMSLKSVMSNETFVYD